MHLLSQFGACQAAAALVGAARERARAHWAYQAFEPVTILHRNLIAHARTRIRKAARVLLAPLVVLIAVPACSQMQQVSLIVTIAGTGTAGYSGNGGPATSAELTTPTGTAFDSIGNIYIVDNGLCAVGKITIATGNILVYAGNGSCSYGGDGGSATSAAMANPTGIAIDSAGNVYIADTNNARIRKVTASSGNISTVAGNGTTGSTGDGGAATSAELYSPTGVAVDSAGNIYIADSANNKIRKVTVSTGKISTVAGTGTGGYSGDGAAATSAALSQPTGVALDSAGNVYIADKNNSRIRKITIATGYISTVAGNGSSGFAGDGAAATSAEISNPNAVAVDPSGNIYIADTGNNRIRKVNIGTGYISTITGNGTAAYAGDNGAATSAEINQPKGIVTDSNGNVYLSDTNNNVVREILQFNGLPTTAIGSSSAVRNLFLQTTAAETLTSFTASQSQNSKQEFTVGTITGCTVNGSTSNPSGTICTVPITFSPAYPGVRNVPLTVVTGTGNIAFGLSGIGTGPLVAMTPGVISTAAGNGTGGFSGDGAAATSAEVNNSAATLVDFAGNLYIADRNNNVVRKVAAGTGNISTIAGTGTAGYSGDGGAATSAKLNNPEGLAMDPAGNLYIADNGNHRIRKLTVATGIITTYAGNGTGGYSGDGGAATSAELNYPVGIALDSSNNLYIADSNNNRIREVNASTGIITTFAGNGTNGSSGDGSAATSAELSSPDGVFVEPSGDVYIGDHNNNKIREVIAGTGLISTFAGNGTAGSTGDGGAATSAELNSPWGVVEDSAGNVYIAEDHGYRIRVVNANTGNISTIAGNGTQGYSGDAGAATSAELAYPEGISLDNAGNLYIADAGNNRIRKVTVGQSSLVFPTSTPVATTDGTDDPETTTVANIGNSSLTVAIPSSGANPSVSTNFVLDAATTCPELTTASSAGTLASGATCSYAVDFQPTAAGSISGSVVLTDNSLAVTGATQTISTSGTASKGTPIITWATPSPITYGTALGATQLDASSTVAGSFVYTPASGTVLNAGSQTLSVTLTPTDSADYNTATQTVSLTVNAVAPTITFTVSNQTYGVAPFAVSATSNSAGVITYSVVSGPATISGSIVTITGVGTVVLQASQTANGNYTAGTQNASFTVSNAAPTITFNVSNQTFGVAPFAVSATSNSAATITYSVVSGPATISGSTVTITGAGTVVLQASQAANGNYTAGTQNATFTVSAAAPTITFSVANKTYGVAPFTVSATSNSAGAITYSVVSGPATISGSTVTITGSGTVVLQASQAANGNYTAGTQNATFTVSAAAPTITFNVSNQTYGVAPFAVSATSNSAGAITYSVVSGPATISGSTVTITGVGSVVLQASQATNGNYTAGTQNASFTVSAAAPTITFSVANKTYGVAPFAVSASSNSAGTITYSVVSGPATISGSTVTITGVGTVVLQASQAANGNYTSGTQNATFTVSAAAPTITFNVSNQTYGVAPFTVSATSNSAGAITYSVVSGPATIAGSTLTITGVGTVVLQASQAANGNYTAGTQNASFTVSQATKTITFPQPTTPVNVNATATLTATTSNSDPIVYTVTAGTATIVGSTITYTTAGTVTIQASSAATANYAAATPISVTVTVNGAASSYTAPTTYVGATSAMQTATVNITAAGTLNTISVLTQGVSGLDYAYVTGGTCAPATVYSVGQACTVQYTFGPIAPGIRYGAVVLFSSTPAVLGTSFLSGLGTGAAVGFPPGIISTIAGNGTTGYSGDGGQATTAEIDNPSSVAVDPAGNVYFSDSANNRVRKISTSGVITTLAGNGTACPSTTNTCGDGAAATSAEIHNPQAVALDGAGNLYIADTGDNRIREVVAGTGIINTFAGNGTAAYAGDGGSAASAELSGPYGLAVRSDGTVYISDTGNLRIRAVNPATGVISTVAGSGSYGTTGNGAAAVSATFEHPWGLALDASNNLYIVDNWGQTVRMVSASTGNIAAFAGNGTQGYAGDGAASASAELSSPESVKLDAAGNVYIADTVNNRIRMVSASTGYIATVAGNGNSSFSGDGGQATSAAINYPYDMAPDAAGNLYIADYNSSHIRKVNLASAPSVSFPSTAVGLASSQVAQAVENIGNSTLTISSISVPTNFSLGGASNTCATSSQTLAPSVSCVLGMEFAPTTAGSLTGNLTLTDNTLNVGGSTQALALSGTATGDSTSTVITSSANPSTYLGSVTFTATVASSSTGTTPTGTVQFNIDGSNVGSPVTLSSGTATYTTSTLTAGSHTVIAVYTPGSTSFVASTSANFTQIVNKATPTITWATPSPITYGTALSSTQLNAGSTVAGTFVYTPASGTVLTAGTQTLSVTLTPTDTTDYATATQTVSLVVNKATPTITWATPSAITYGTALSSAQLNAGSTVAGTFVYTPASGTVLTAGTQTLSVTLTPTDTTDYATATQTVSLVVNKATPTITWATPSAITYGAALSSTQLNAGSTVAGTFVYTPASGTVLTAGTQTLSVTLTPTDTTDYTTATQTVSLTVNKSGLTITGTSSLPVSRFGDTVTITFTFIGAGVTPTGTTTIKDGATTLGTVPLVAGVATLQTSTLVAGVHTIKATYNGDGNYQ